jgi:hypothetical protein
MFGSGSAFREWRTVRRGREDATLVTDDARRERTANLLIARLDALIRVAGRLPTAETQRLVELAGVATMRAVALQLLEAERAETIWRDAHARNPRLPTVQIEPPDRLAA